MVRRSTAAYLVLATADVLLAAAGRDRARRLTKPLLMPALLPGRDTSTRTALAFGWGGDVALLGSGDAAFTAGLGSFLAGHVAWISALRHRDAGGRLRSRIPAAAAEAGAFAVLNAYLWNRTGRHRLPVLGYSAALLATGLVALDSRSARVAAGGALFLVSDGVLALQRFGALRVPGGDALVMATYAAAQALLAGPGNGGPVARVSGTSAESASGPAARPAGGRVGGRLVSGRPYGGDHEPAAAVPVR